jgi:hypothetical protein
MRLRKMGFTGWVLFALFCASCHAGVVAYWRFDEDSGSVASDSVGPYHGTLEGGAAFAPGEGIAGGAISLNRVTGDYVTMGDVLDLADQDFTLSAWIRTTDATDNYTFVVSTHWPSSITGYLLGLNSHNGRWAAGKAGFFFSGSQDCVSSTTVNDGGWHHLAVVYRNGVDVQLYIDGALEDTRSAVPVVPTAADFIIGGCYLLGGLFTGLIDDVQVHDCALSAEEVAFLFDHPGRAMPRISGVALDAGTMTLSITDLAPGVPNHVQRCLDLAADEWLSVDVFESDTLQTDRVLAIADECSQAFFRLVADSKFTQLLLHGEGEHGSWTFVDEMGHAVTVFGEVRISTDKNKFGNSSLYFDGSADYLEIPDSPDFEPGADAFTIDFWINADTGGYNTYLVGKSHPNGGRGYDIRLHNNAIQVCGVNGWGFNMTSDAVITTGDWHHIAWCGTPRTNYLFIDGVLKGTCPRSSIADQPEPFRIGFTLNYGGTAYQGHMDEVRVSKGIARWVSDFSPPDAPYEPD